MSDERYCPAHAPAARRRRIGAWAERSPLTRWQWEQLVERIVARDRVCKLGLPGCTGTAQTADHIRPRANGGSDHPDNLRGACFHCNRSRGNRDVTTRPSSYVVHAPAPELAESSPTSTTNRTSTTEPVPTNHTPLVPWIG